MDYKQIKANYYIDSVSIESDDFHYVRLTKTHNGIQINENLKEREDLILKKCDEISELMFELRELL